MKRASLVLLVASACYDPVHADAVAALGPEASGVPPGELHRPGQPCTTCHGGAGPAEQEFVVAGTVFQKRAGTEPARGVTVTIRDARNDVRRLQTNQAGNFFITESEWPAIFPLHVEIAQGDVQRKMISTIGRDGGCGGCHRGAGDKQFMPGVYLREL